MSERLDVLATEVLPDDIIVGLDWPVRAIWAYRVHMDVQHRAVYVHSWDNTVVLDPTRVVEVVRGA